LQVLYENQIIIYFDCTLFSRHRQGQKAFWSFQKGNVALFAKKPQYFDDFFVFGYSQIAIEGV
ncbi:MAG: hypothetical protein U0M15_03530, partial [Bacillota bacterium]|nr:hypothetical protein [Bacillota bacterium]